MISIYRAVMDSTVNSLRSLPPAQRFQLMLLLSVMWTTVFCVSATAWMWYGELMVFHVLVLAAIFVTSLVFRRASRTARHRYATYRHHPLKDGTARYDDVWGG